MKGIKAKILPAVLTFVDFWKVWFYTQRRSHRNIQGLWNSLSHEYAMYKYSRSNTGDREFKKISSSVIGRHNPQVHQPERIEWWMTEMATKSG